MMNLDVEVQIDEVEYSSGAEFDEIDVEGQHDELYEDNKHLMYRSQMGQNIPRTRPSRHNPLGDPNGRYPCYIDGCKWRGNFRSVRCTHMRNVHPDWVRPPRFVLNRISRDGHVLPANDANARYSCFIDGCPWRGNYRASRSNHMKTQHKGWVPKRTRAKNGGFVENGRYHCHVEECGWRGMSRSTRAVHMRREHPGFVNPIYTPRNIPCTDCGSSMTSHKLFVDHMVVEHKIGGIVQREFTDARDYEDWFEAVQESFSIDFIKKMGVKNGPNYQILYLYCARSGGYCPARGYDKKLDPMGLYEPRHAKHFRRRDKCGRNCAAFLRVMHWNDGRLSIIGCVEHTGHRLGTALLRLSPIEREAMDEYLYMMEENTPLDLIIDRLREIEGLSAAGYEPRLRPVDFVRQFVMDGDERKSLNVLLNNLEFFPEDSSFGIVPPPEDQYALSVGWMDSQMKELWKEYAHKGVCLEEVRLMLGEWDLRVMLVIVLDMNQNPRIAALYISNSSDKRPLMDHITSIWSGEVATFVTDYSSEYPDLLERYFGHFSEGELDLQFAEWHLLSEWAATIDQLVINRVDKYGIICVLRRLLRTTDSNVFDQTINELFDGLREMQLDEVAQYVDDQLDPIFLKRWSPSGRNPLTEHNNPTLEFACRMLRERFISCEQCTRIDEYVGFLIQRIREFNESELSAIYATRESDPPRELPQHYMELALEECELGGSVVRHELDDEEGEAWADFGQRANGIQGIHPRFNQIDLSYDKSRIVDMEASGSEQNGVKPPGMEELVEEIVEEEVVPFEQAELLNQMVQEGEFVGDDEDYSQSSGGRPEGKRQRLLNMMSALQHRLEHLADDECIELVEGSIEQVVNKLQTATPKK